jgi:DNA-binding CsgD family transcriptional regulator
LEVLRAPGLGELAAENYVSAVNDLTAVANAVEAGGVNEPEAFPVAADLVEALVGARQFEDARNTLARFESVSRDQDHPWGLAAAARGRGVLLAQEGRTDEAKSAFSDAIERHGHLGLEFELARTQLALGILHRRSRRIADARVLLEIAAAAFDRLGSPPFAARARDELAQVGGRRRGEGLTATEERVAALVTDGLTNKDVADTLFVTVSTVEAHLTRIYNKLGIHSRSELVRRTLLERPIEDRAGDNAGIP